MKFNYILCFSMKGKGVGANSPHLIEITIDAEGYPVEGQGP
jgi:hypothetical protein